MKLNIKEIEESIRRYVDDVELGLNRVKNADMNCYQFSLGIFDLYFPKRLMPGEIAGKAVEDSHRYTDEELVNLVIKDLETVGFMVTVCEEQDKFNKSEWIIAVLNGETNESLYDFHFLRKINTRYWGFQWRQKLPGEQLSTEIDEYDEIIVSPATAKYAYNYHVVTYLKIMIK